MFAFFLSFFSVLAVETNEKKPLTKLDIGAPMPLSEGVKTELAKKWMISDIKDIKSFSTSGPDSGITSEGPLTASNNNSEPGGKSGNASSNANSNGTKNNTSCMECGYQSRSSGVMCDGDNPEVMGTRTQSVCSCSILASTTPGGQK